MDKFMKVILVEIVAVIVISIQLCHWKCCPDCNFFHRHYKWVSLHRPGWETASGYSVALNSWSAPSQQNNPNNNKKKKRFYSMWLLISVEKISFHNGKLIAFWKWRSAVCAGCCFPLSVLVVPHRRREALVPPERARSAVCSLYVKYNELTNNKQCEKYEKFVRAKTQPTQSSYIHCIAA